MLRILTGMSAQESPRPLVVHDDRRAASRAMIWAPSTWGGASPIPGSHASSDGLMLCWENRPLHDSSNGSVSADRGSIAESLYSGEGLLHKAFLLLLFISSRVEDGKPLMAKNIPSDKMGRVRDVV